MFVEEFFCASIRVNGYEYQIGSAYADKYRMAQEMFDWIEHTGAEQGWVCSKQTGEVVIHYEAR